MDKPLSYGLLSAYKGLKLGEAGSLPHYQAAGLLSAYKGLKFPRHRFAVLHPRAGLLSAYKGLKFFKMERYAQTEACLLSAYKGLKLESEDAEENEGYLVY